MKNMFPVADIAAIEPTIGITRPTASPPKDQPVTTSTVLRRKAAGLLTKPAWFSFTEISQKEKNMVAGMHLNYFTPQQNEMSAEEQVKAMEEEYLTVRNTILKMHQDTNEYLPLNVVFKTSNYRLATLAYNFLEDSKLINNSVDLLEVCDELYEIAEAVTNNNFNMERTSPEQIVVCTEPTEQREMPKEAESEFYTKRETRRVKEKHFKKEMLENATCTCGHPALYFTSDLLFICEICYLNSSFPSKYTIKNFHKLTPQLLDSIWTRKEEYILLRNIEMFGDAWHRVTEGLNKTFEQCIFHFIKMSIVEGVTHFPSTVFTQIPNPLSTLTAMVCGLVHPSIATELARKTLQQINNPKLMDVLLSSAQSKGEEIIKLEKKKIEKLGRVEAEAMIRQVVLKVDAINEMHAEIQAVKTELEDERERLVEEMAKMK